MKFNRIGKRTQLMCLALITLSSTNAAIIYNDIADVTLTSGGTLEIDFNGGGAEFTFNDGSFGGTVEPGIMFNADAGFVMLGTPPPGSGWDEVASLTLNTTIDATSNFQNIGADGFVDPGWTTTPFSTGDSYIGAVFKIGATVHYGWILVNWDGNGTFIVKSHAYNDTPNTAILAGDSGGQVNGIEDNNTLNVSVFPNPFTNRISISTDINSSISIIDITGKVVYATINLNELIQLDLSELKTGVYFLSISNNNTKSISKLIKE